MKRALRLRASVDRGRRSRDRPASTGSLYNLRWGSSMSTTAESATAIRPFRAEFPDEGVRGPSPAHRGDAMAREGDGRRCFAGHAARDDAGPRALLGQRLRLPEVRG